MPRYTVIVTRDITESTIVVVDAETEDQAEEAALEKLRNDTEAQWDVDEGSWNNSDPYVTGIDLTS
ncbi:MAG: hypothetical protein HQL34_00805 [Alphaproteobacteria bacterium]|nr:hypothetical protein [Alphaproteobacteria bacterium]